MEGSDWQDRKLEIARLYLEEDKLLKEVMQIMLKTYGFDKTASQYNSQLTRWGFKKYRMGPKRLAATKRKMDVRGGENFEVYVDRIQHCPKRLRREASRQVYTPFIDTLCSASSPATPEGVVICSPGPSSLALQWPVTLPWFSFLNMIQLSGEPSFSIYQPSSPSISREVGKLFPQSQKDMLSLLGSILFWKTTGRLSSIQSTSRVVAVLSVIMPEEREGQHLQLAEKLCKPHAFPAQELLQILLFLLSNNLLFEKSTIEDDTDFSKRDTFVMQLFRVSGLNNVDRMRFLLSQPNSTAEAIVEQLFGCAMRSHDTTAIQLMLKAGVNPNKLIPASKWTSRTPLAIAASGDDTTTSVRIASILMAHGAALYPKNMTDIPIILAIRGRQYELLKFLLVQGDEFPSWLLCNRRIEITHLLDVKMLQIFFEGGWTDIENTSWGGPDNGSTLLGMSVRREDSELFGLLQSWGANTEAHQAHTIKWAANAESHLETTTPLGLAASACSMTMLQALLAAGAQVNLVNSSLIPPLVLAVANGHHRAAKFLLSQGADVWVADCFLARRKYVNTTLIRCALVWKDPELCQLLLKVKARIGPYDKFDLMSMFLIDSIRQNNVRRVSQLVRMSPPSNVDSLLHEHGDPLIMAIVQGNCEIVTLLVKAGARLQSGGVCSVADSATVTHLSQIGLLPQFLVSSGRQALISAFLLDQQDLATTLLSYDADRREFSGSPCEKWKFFESPLEAAILRGNWTVAEMLINRGAAISEVEVSAFVWRIIESNEARDLHIFWNPLRFWRPSAPTAIGMALKFGENALVHQLLAAGVDPRGKPVDYDNRELDEAIEGADGDIFVLKGQRQGMIAGWWNFSKPDTFYHLSVLELATTTLGDPSTLHALLEYQWTSEAKGRALTRSLKENRTDLAHILLASNADVNQVIDDLTEISLYAPLYIAVQKTDLSMTQTLIAAGCDVNHCVGFGEESHTILEEAVKFGDVNIVKALLAAGALVNAPHGSTNALNTSIEEERLDLVQLLLQAGANVNSPPYPYSGRTALQLAVEQGNSQLIELLIQAGSDVNQEPALKSGATALQLAAIKGYIGIVRRLINLGANVSAPGARENGRTALEGAAEHGHIDTVRLLLEEGALFQDSGCRQYWRAVRLAEKNAAYATANLLKSTIGWTNFDALHATDSIFKIQTTKMNLWQR